MKQNVHLTSDGVLFTLITDGGGRGLNISTLFIFLKTIEKVTLAVNLILKKGGHIDPLPPSGCVLVQKNTHSQIEKMKNIPF